MYHNESIEALTQFGLSETDADTVIDRLDNQQFTFEQVVFTLDIYDTMIDMLGCFYRIIKEAQEEAYQKNSTAWFKKARELYPHFGRAIAGWSDDSPVTFTRDGIVLRRYEDHYARSCHVGSDSDTFTFSKELFTAMQADRYQAAKDFVLEQTIKIHDAVDADERAARLQHQQEVAAQEERERAEFERLSKKFSTL